MNSKHYKYLILSLTIPTISVVSLLLRPSNAYAASPRMLGKAIYQFIENPSLFLGLFAAVTGILLIVRYNVK
ncbi:MAG TPA: hypothetical protein ACFCUY_06620 [Xenococcaceae cyanobacterium]